MTLRRAAKVDKNQPEIVAALRKLGVSVWIIREPVDLMVSYRGRTMAIEVKDGTASPAQQALTKGQVKFFETDRGCHAVVRNVAEAIEAVKGMVA